MRKRPDNFDRGVVCEFPYEEDDFSVVSSCECTGLVSEIPYTDEETESYKDIYNIPLEPFTASKNQSKRSE